MTESTKQRQERLITLGNMLDKSGSFEDVRIIATGPRAYLRCRGHNRLSTEPRFRPRRVRVQRNITARIEKGRDGKLYLASCERRWPPNPWGHDHKSSTQYALVVSDARTDEVIDYEYA